MGRGALFQASDTAHVELVEMADVQEVPEPRTTIGLQIRDVDEVHERLKAFGAKIKAPPKPAAAHKIVAWKTYTQYGPGGKGYFLTDDVGIRFIVARNAAGASRPRWSRPR